MEGCIMNDFTTPRISVIVPVYNSESSLYRCVDSILSQNFKNFELLLIDDGSTDRSGEICDEYAKKDFRVKVFHKENGGVSSARNVGLDNAKGEWITFVDSDDYIYNVAFDKVQSYTTDLLIFNYKIESGNKLIDAPKIAQYDINQMLEKYLCFEIFRTPWAKFFRRDIIAELHFDTEILIGEDTLFVIQYLNSCSLITYCNIDYYVWKRPEISPAIKYRLHVADAVADVIKIYDSYKNLKIRSVDFERFIYEFYLSLCSEDIMNNLRLWYGNQTIFVLWQNIKYTYCFKTRIMYVIKKYCPNIFVDIKRIFNHFVL